MVGMTGRFLNVLGFAAALLIAAPAAAGAATPFTAGTGVNPRIAVSPNGTGHVVWGIPRDGVNPARVGYCRIPAGASACDRTETINYPVSLGDVAESGGHVTVHAFSDTTIEIYGACYECGSGGGAVDRIQGWQSVNGGTSFGAVPELGTTPTTTGIGQDGIRLPGGGPFVTPASGDEIIARPGSSASVQPVSGFLFVYSPSIVRVPGLNKLVYAVSNLAVVKTAVYNGPSLTAAAIMTQGSWTTDRLLPSAEAENDETDLNAGPSGVWLTYLNKVTLDPHFAIRRFDTGTDTFGAPRYLESAGAIDTDVGYPSSSQDASGRVHGVWRTLHDTGRLRYVRSDTTGATFSEPANLAAGETFIDPEVAAGPDGNGWAVWEGLGTSPIRVVRIEPYPEPGPTPPPAPAPAPTPTGPTGPGAPVLKTVTVPGASISFGVPTGCVQPGSTFRVTLSWKRKKKKGNLFVKVSRADFYIGTKVVRKDRKAPFVQTLRVTASAKRGSTISLRARAFIKVKRGKAPKKSVKATIRVCA